MTITKRDVYMWLSGLFAGWAFVCLIYVLS